MWEYAFNETVAEAQQPMRCIMDDEDSVIFDDVEEEDPFALFDEWASPEDTAAFDALMPRP